MSSLPRILVMTTGGTIASALDSSGRSLSGALPGDALMKNVALPEALRARVNVISVLQKPSNAITRADLVALREQCLDAMADPGVQGIVITHGTDTLEDTAFFLDLTLTSHKPVVVTGSQRPPHQAGTDAFTNLGDAIRVAAAEQARGLGTLVVFNQSLFAARQVRKVSTYQLDGFAAPAAGPVGQVDGENLLLLQRPVDHQVFELPSQAQLPRVDIVPAYLDASPALLECAIDNGAAGIVIDALGRGHVPPDWMPAVRDATSQGLPVLVTSSCLSGPLHQSYEFSGSLVDLCQAGVLPVSGLGARKARIALSVLLASDTPPAAALDALTH